MPECPNLPECGFVKKYGETNGLAVKGFITMYCKGEKQNECKRKEYKQKMGNTASDEMLPTGLIMKDQFV